VLSGKEGPIVVSTDYIRAYPDQIRAYLPKDRDMLVLGTDGYGRPHTRDAQARPRGAHPACPRIAHEAPADVHLSQTRQEDHGGRKLHADVRKVLRSLAPERGHRLCGLQCIAYAVAQGPIHVGDEGHACAAHALPDGDHLLGKVQGVIKRLHEGTASARDVEQDPVGACRDLLARDAGRDGGDAVHGGRDVTQGVEPLVCGNEVPRLTDDGAAHLAHNPLKAGAIHGDAQAGNRLELVEGATGVAKTSPAHLGHAHAKRRHKGNHHERGLVPDTSC